jgi:hypothetical protein
MPIKALLALGTLLGLEPVDRMLGGAPRLPVGKVRAAGVGAERPGHTFIRQGGPPGPSVTDKTHMAGGRHEG